MYSRSPNNSSTSLSDNDDDEVIKDISNAGYPYFEREFAPAQWSSPASARGCRPQTPQHSSASQLPPEILIHILRRVHSSRDLYSALLVSKAWCECAVELLWHRPSFSEITRFVQMLQVVSSENRLFDYSRFIRRLNFVYLARDLSDSLFVRLAKCVKLERLTLVNCVELSDDALIRVLPQCANLVAVDLTNITSCTDRVVIALAQSATKLQGLNLGGCKNVTDEGVLAVATHCPLLRRIKLSNIKNVTDAAIKALARQCPLLLEIDLHGCHKITDEAVRDLWVHLAHLRDFRLAHCSDLTDFAFPAPPQARPAETQLAVQPFPNSTPIPNEVLPPLRLHRLCEHMRMLDLTSCVLITDEAVAGIVAVAPKIRNLYLAKCSQLTDAAVESICKLGKHLHYLHLGHASSITDRSVRTLARSCTRLRYIDLACCPLLTDLSVFELSGLPKLRRIGLVRVTNLTDQAIFSLADCHSTLERIHLSYCEHITVLAIHFLLQRLTKLTHLSLTGIPAFRRAELQQFCRAPPREFNTNQRAAFCVYSGKGVENLRLYLAELMAHVQAEVNAGENDSDYDLDEDEFPSSNSDQDSRNVITHISDVETPRIPYRRDQQQEWRGTTNGFGVTTEEFFEDESYVYGDGYGRINLAPSTMTTVRGHPGRAIGNQSQTPEAGALIVEDIRPSSSATTPSPTALPQSGNAAPGPSGTRSRVFGQDPIVEPPTPSPRITPYASRHNAHSQSVPSFHRANSNASDEASNRSAHSSATNRTTASNGAGFFRNYVSNGHSSSDAALASRGGAYTPDLVYAELGHGKGGGNSNLSGEGVGMAGPGPRTIQQAGRLSESSTSSFNGSDATRIKQGYLNLNGSDTVLNGENGARAGVLIDSSNTCHRSTSSRSIPSLRGYQYHDPTAPIPYLSSSPTTRELQESVHSALAGASTNTFANNSSSITMGMASSSAPAASGIIQEDAVISGSGSSSIAGAVGDSNRGRSVRRSLKNTLSAAEHYASALFFRNGTSTTGSGTSVAPTSSASTGAGSVPGSPSARDRFAPGSTVFNRASGSSSSLAIGRSHIVHDGR